MEQAGPVVISRSIIDSDHGRENSPSPSRSAVPMICRVKTGAASWKFNVTSTFNITVMQSDDLAICPSRARVH
jgi:hypothetical protein